MVAENTVQYPTCPYPRPKFNPEIHYFGNLCLNRHDYGNGCSLRQKTNHSCISCRRHKSPEQKLAKLKYQRKYRELKRSEKVKVEKVVYPSCPYPEQKFNSQTQFLGSLCHQQHDRGDGRTIRRKRGGSCIECARLKRFEKNESSDRPFTSPACPYPRPKLNPQIHCLAKLCKRGHDYGNGFSLRRIRKGKAYGKCVVCELIEKRDYYQRSSKCRDGQKACRQARKELYRQFSRSNYYRHRDQRLLQVKKYQATVAGKATKQRSESKRRTAKESGHHFPWTKQEWQERIVQFDGKCAYCGESENITVDHFIALTKGGTDTFSNIVPACLKCNCSKSNSDPKDWFSMQPFYSPQRWKKVLKILGKKDSNYTQLSLF